MAQGNYGTASNPLADVYGEFWEFTGYTSDPAHTQGDLWLRTDLTSGDKIATLRFDNGTSVVDIPVYATSTDPNDTSIKKVARIDTPNGIGWFPVLESGGTYSYLGYQHGGTRHGVHDSLTAAIPDSELDHRYPTDAGSGTTQSDVLGSQDFSITGATWVTGSGGKGNAYLSFDATDDYSRNATPSAWDANSFTWCVWFNPTDLSTQTILCNSADTGNSTANYLLDIGVSTDNLRYWILDGDAGSNVEITTPAVTTGTWNFAGFVADNGNQATAYHATAADADLSVIGSQNYDQGLGRAVEGVVYGALWDDGSSSPSRVMNGGIDHPMCNIGTALGQSTVEQIFDATKDDYQ